MTCKARNPGYGWVTCDKCNIIVPEKEFSCSQKPAPMWTVVLVIAIMLAAIASPFVLMLLHL